MAVVAPARLAKRLPADFIITEAVFKRPRKTLDLAAEVRAFHDLSSLMLRNPGAAIQRFLNHAVALCDAGSAGLSRLVTNDTGEQLFRWDALAGVLQNYVGGSTPRHLSPCGLCLDRGHTIVVSRPARVFDYFNEVPAPIVEGLVVPIYDTARIPLGTLWIVHHDDRPFDANDIRVMEQLAMQIVLALKLSEHSTRPLAFGVN